MLILGDCITMTEPERLGALRIDGGRIHEVGSAADLTARHPGEERVRIERVTPGLHDAHVHPTLWGQALARLDLAGLTDPREVAERVAARHRELPDGQWLLGGGYLFDHHPEAALLDEAAPGRPVLLDSRDLHSAWASTAALERAGVRREAPDPEGGSIVRDAGGRPSGTLLEKAVALVKRALPDASRDDFERGLADFAARGYTAVHAMDYEPTDALPWAEELGRARRLPVRLWWAVPRSSWRGIEPGWRGDDLQVAAVKLFADGALGSRTALMHEPYLDGSFGSPVDTLEEIRTEADAAFEAGYSVVIHAIGTRAVAEIAALVRELAPRAPHRIRIEHVQHVRDADLIGLAALPAALSLQPIHLGEDAGLVRSRLPGREHEAFRLRDLWSTGCPIALGSDAPVAPPDLIAGLAAATAHPLVAGQSLTGDEVLRGHTRGAAEAAGWVYAGILAPGARADLALWEQGKVVGRVFRGELEWLSPRRGA